MRKTDPATSCLLTAASQSPLQLWGMQNESLHLRATYVPMDGEQIAQTVVSAVFTASGSNIICGGSRESLYIFDTGRPGKYPMNRLRLSPSRGSREGLKGLVSALAPRADDTPIVAAGSFGGSLGIYDWRTPGTVMVVGGACASTAITQLAFHRDGWHLVGSRRKDEKIFCMDLRTTSPSTAVYSWDRGDCNTNQRLHFSLDGNRLAFGNRIGSVSIVNDIFRSEESTVQFTNLQMSTPGIALSEKMVGVAAGERSKETDDPLDTGTLTVYPLERSEEPKVTDDPLDTGTLTVYPLEEPKLNSLL